jgi:phosphatidylcholine synthase
VAHRRGGDRRRGRAACARLGTKRFAAEIDGRTIDDIVDYLTFTFIPLLLVWRMGWVPFAPGLAGAAWIVPALLASLLGFAHVGAKDEAAGYFRGFPSYWNIAAFYAGLAFHGLGEAGQWLNGAVLLALAALTVSPVRFIYPNLAPRPWKLPVMVGAAVWAAVLGGMLLVYRTVPGWVVWASLIYPLFYAALSLLLDPQRRRGRAADRGDEQPARRRLRAVLRSARRNGRRARVAPV